jgi:hypothetical protein
MVPSSDVTPALEKYPSQPTVSPTVQSSCMSDQSCAARPSTKKHDVEGNEAEDNEGIGLDAIAADLEGGKREAPLADDPEHRVRPVTKD